ncbi:DUF6603 domain-containing protein [Embleya sp. NPDC055664]
MAIPVPALLELFDAASTSGRLELSGATLDIPEVAALFDGYLNGGLTLSTPLFDREGLAADGTSDIPELGAKLATHVVFLADEPGEFVIGCRVEVATDAWTVKAPYLETDLTLLATLGFDRLWITFAAVPDTPGGRVRPDVYPAVSFSLGATDGRRTMRLVGAESPVVGLSEHFPNGISFERLTDLAALPFLDASLLDRVHVPAEISGGLGALSLMSASVTFDRYRGRLEEVVVTLRLAGEADWAVIPGALRLDRIDPLRIRAARDRSGTWRVDFTLGARCTVAGAYALHGEVALPAGRLAASLWHPGGGNDLIDAEALAGTGIDPGTVRLNYIHISADVTSKAYTLALALDTAWRIADGVELTALELRTAVTGVAPATDVALAGTLDVGGSRIVLEGRRRPDKVWEVTGSAFRVEFAGFAAWFDETFGVPLPQAVSGLVLDRLQVSLDSGLAGEVVCAGSFPLGDGPDGAMFTLTASVGAKPPSGPREVRFAADLSVEVDIDGEMAVLDFAVEFGTGGAGSRFTASWQAAVGTAPVSIFALLAALGVEEMDELRRLLPPALTPSLRSVAITYDGAAGSTMIAAEFGQGTVVFASVPEVPGQVPPGSRVSLVQVGVNVRAGLSDLPLLADVIPAGADLRLSGVRAVYASRQASPAVVNRANALLAEAGSTLPPFPHIPGSQGQIEGGLRRGAVMVVDYQLPASAPASLTLGLPPTPTPGGTGVRHSSHGWESTGDRPGMRAPTDPTPPEATDGGGTAQAVPDGAVLEGVVWPAGSAAPGSLARVLLPNEGVFAAAPGTSAPGVWLDVGRSFGPLHVARIGLAYDKGTVWLMVDASLSAAGLTIGVAGLGLGIDLNGDDSFPVRTRLDGLGVGFERPPLHVAGALVSRPNPPEWPVLVQGSLTVELAPKFSVLAIGAYQKSRTGAVSLFVFGRASVPFGGPPPFHVTGFALGFGYQSSVRIPEQHEIGSFPLVAGLDDEDFPADSLQVLALLTGGENPWVKPAQGQIWLAGGLNFTSFEFVRTRVLLLLEAGSDLTLALIGRANASFPHTGTAYARIGVDMRVVYQSKRGELAVTAQLVDSYVIDPACVLTGGFAFYLWSGRSPYAGDFVVTVGGYHPAYKVPSHFPVVPRLGFSWSLGSVSITGGSYFALTPNAVMAGGMLDVRYRSGNVEAWLTAKADILVQWAPLSFRAGISVSVGVKVKLLFTLRGELGASLDLWGPPTGGTVRAKFVFITVTVRFGAQLASPPPLTWAQFAAQLLPGQVPLTVTALTGLTADADADPELRAARVEAGEEPWLVDPAAFSFAVATVVPTRRVRFDTRPDVGDKGVDIRPMGKTGLDGLLHVSVAYKPTDAGRQEAWRAVPGLDRWIVEPEYGRVPFSMWGDPAIKTQDALKPGHEAMLTHLTGLRVSVPPHRVNGQDLGPITDGDLAWETLDPDAPNPLNPADPPTGPPVRVPAPAGTGVAVVADHLATLSSATARTRLHGALGALLGHDDLPNGTLGTYADQAATVGLDADPLLLTHDTAPPPPASALLILDDTTTAALALDPDSGTVLGRVAGLERGPYLATATADGARLYVVGDPATRIDILDTATMRPEPPLPLGLGARPRALALNRAGTRLVAAAPAAQSTAAVSLDLTGAREPVATNAYDSGAQRIDALALDAESGHLYAVETNTSKTAAFDTETGIYIGHVPEPSAPLRVSAVPGQDVLFVYGSEQGGNGIVQVRPRPPGSKYYEPYRFPKKATAKAMLVDTNNQAVLARAFTDNTGHLATFAVHNGAPGSTRLVSDVPLDTAPVALVLDPRNRRWVLHAAAVSVVDGATARGTLTLDAAPLAIAFSADAARAYLVCADTTIAVVEIGDTGPHLLDRWDLPAGTVASAALFTLFTAGASTRTAFTPSAPEGTAR